MSVGSPPRPPGRRAPPPPIGRPPRRPDFGLDAPGIVYGCGWGGFACLTMAMLLPSLGLAHGRVLGRLVGYGFAWGMIGIGTAVAMIASSRFGKLVVRQRVLDGLALRGDERVLDVGCGRGLMLVGAAERLTTGRAVGIDRWSQRDQRANRREATLENARRAGVEERVEVHDGDMRELPFRDRSFDVVLSSLAVHNVRGRAERARAVAEMVRVLRPGGRLVIVDIGATGEYVAALRGAGVRAVARTAPRFWIYPPVRIVSATR